MKNLVTVQCMFTCPEPNKHGYILADNKILAGNLINCGFCPRFCDGPEFCGMVRCEIIRKDETND